jgi:hypothetical protein
MKQLYRLNCGKMSFGVKPLNRSADISVMLLKNLSAGVIRFP